MLARTISSVVDGLPLSQETRSALLGRDNASRRVLDAVIMHERGAWAAAEAAAERAGISAADVAGACRRDPIGPAIESERRLGAVELTVARHRDFFFLPGFSL
jgi:hypothetical protein